MLLTFLDLLKSKNGSIISLQRTRWNRKLNTKGGSSQPRPDGARKAGDSFELERSDDALPTSFFYESTLFVDNTLLPATYISKKSKRRFYYCLVSVFKPPVLPH